MGMLFSVRFWPVHSAILKVLVLSRAGPSAAGRCKRAYRGRALLCSLAPMRASARDAPGRLFASWPWSRTSWEEIGVGGSTHGRGVRRDRSAPASAGRARPTPSGPLRTRGDPDTRGYPHRLSRSSFGFQFIQFSTNLHMAKTMFTVVPTTPQPLENAKSSAWCHPFSAVRYSPRAARCSSATSVASCSS